MLPQAIIGKLGCIFTTDWIEEMCGEKKEGSAFTTGFLDAVRATEYIYMAAKTRSNVHLPRLLHRSTVEVVHLVAFHPRSPRLVKHRHQLGQPFPRLIPMADGSAAVRLLRLQNRGKHAEMIVLAGRDDHIAGRVEKGRVHRERVLVFVQAIQAGRQLFLLVQVRLPGRWEFPNVPQFRRPRERSRQNVRLRGMHIDLVGERESARPTVLTFFVCAWKQASVLPLRSSIVKISLVRRSLEGKPVAQTDEEGVIRVREANAVVQEDVLVRILAEFEERLELLRFDVESFDRFVVRAAIQTHPIVLEKQSRHRPDHDSKPFFFYSFEI